MEILFIYYVNGVMRLDNNIGRRRKNITGSLRTKPKTMVSTSFFVGYTVFASRLTLRNREFDINSVTTDTI